MGDESAFVLGLACCGTGLDERLELDELVRVVFEQRSDLRFGFSRPQRGNLRLHQRLVSMELGRFGCVRRTHLFRLGFLGGLFRRRCRLFACLVVRRGRLCSLGSCPCLTHRRRCCDLACGRSVLCRFVWVFAVPSRAVNVLQPDDLAVESDFVDEKVGEPAWLGISDVAVRKA